MLRETALSGNTTALIFYLTNRGPDRWADKRNFAGKVAAPVAAEGGEADTAALRRYAPPEYFVEHVLRPRHPLSLSQYEMLRSVAANRRVAIASAHSVGKTHVDAILALWWIWRFEEGVALITGPSDRQTKKVWNELTTLWNGSASLQAAMPGARLLDKSLEVTTMRYIQRFTAQVSTVGGDREAPGGQGFHSAEGALLAIIDEAEGIAEPVVNALEGAMGGPDSRMVMTANPLLRFGPFYEAFSKEGWTCHQMSAFRSPNLEGVTLDDIIERHRADPNDLWFDDNPVPGLTTKRWVLDRWLDWGQHDNRNWYSRVMAEFPPQGSRSMFDARQIAALTEPQERNDDATQHEQHRYRITIDWAGARGGDNFVVSVIQPTAQGDRQVGLYWTNDTADTLTWAMGVIMPYLYYTRVIGIDSTGGGDEFVRRMQQPIANYSMPENLKPKVVRIWVGGPALDSHQYANRRAEMYAILSEKIKMGRYHADLPGEVQTQFVSATFEFASDGRIRMPSKEQMRSQGIPSPDHLDAICMGTAPFEQWVPMSGRVAGL